MITERKRWMTHTYFNRKPGWSLRITHLFSPVGISIPGMVRTPFPTMIVDLSEQNFVQHWSSSTRTKINRAQQENLTIARDNEFLSGILKLFNPPARLKGLRGFEEKDFDTLLSIRCSAVFFDGVMLCGHVWLIDEEEKRALLYVNASSHHQPDDDKSLTGRAHYYLLWQDGLFLQQMDMKTMDLMGYQHETTDTGLKGVYQWKEGTHGKTEMLFHYYPFWFYLLRKLRNMVTR